MGPISLRRLTARVTKGPYFKRNFTAILTILRPFDSFDVHELWMRQNVEFTLIIGCSHPRRQT